MKKEIPVNPALRELMERLVQLGRQEQLVREVKEAFPELMESKAHRVFLGYLEKKVKQEIQVRKDQLEQQALKEYRAQLARSGLKVHRDN